MPNAQMRKILFDHRKHGLQGHRAHKWQPLAFRQIEKVAAVIGGKIFADGLQIISRIKTLGDLADVLAERLR